MANLGRKRRKLFAYMFTLMDLDTRMYIAFGSSMKSEKEAFNRAMRMLRRTDITLKSIRLDKYYSVSKYVSKFGKGTKGVHHTKEERNSKRITEVEGHDEGVCDKHYEIPGGVLQEGKLRSWVLR
jgi:transposase